LTALPDDVPLLPRLVAEFRAKPVTSCMIAAVMVAGSFGLVLGLKASRAFAEIGGGFTGSAIVRFLGTLMLVGAVATFGGVVRWGSLVEMIGLVFVAAGCFVYSVGVISGLGLNGIFAGSMSFGMTVGCTSRVVIWAKAARTMYRADDVDGG
jgi:hypothetical protein